MSDRDEGNRGSRSRSRSRSQPPVGGNSWVQIIDLPPKSNWSSLRRLITGAGGRILTGKVYQHRSPSCAVAELSDAEEAQKVAQKLDGTDLAGRRITVKVISVEQRNKLD
mmetsp:Transcript_140860/g.366688  ORF Transcript_140860/g.366688 Transcript_140860/m.366688 type:complete len:110 (+) Transcript_140860:54-383(+)